MTRLNKYKEQLISAAAHLRKFVNPDKPNFLTHILDAREGFLTVEKWLIAAAKTILSEMLDRMPGYTGSAESIHFRFTTARLEITNLVIEKKVTREGGEPFLRIPKLMLTLDWRHLFKKEIVGTIVILNPEIIFDVQRWSNELPKRPSPERRAQPTWQERLKSIIAFRLKSITVVDGRLLILNAIPGKKDKFEIPTIGLLIKNVTNSLKLAPTLITEGEAACDIGEGCSLVWEGQGNLLEAKPTFKSILTLRGFQLTCIKDLLRHYLNVNVIQGTLDLFAEGEGKDGKFQGYAKPIFDRLEIQPLAQPSLWMRAKTLAFQCILRLLKNKKFDRIATKINFAGTFDHADIDVLAAVGNFVRNAFGSAFKARLDHNVLRYLRHNRDADEQTYRSSETASRRGWKILKEAFTRWMSHEVPRMSAALSYYTCFSLAPLLLLLIAVLGLVFGREAAQGHIIRQLSGLVGEKSAQTIQTMIAAAWQPSKGILAGIISLGTLVVGAFGVLSELKSGLNRVMKSSEPDGITEIVKARAKYLGFILGIGFLLMVSLAVSAGVAALGQMLTHTLPFPKILLQIIDIALSVGVITVLFAMIFRYLPNTRLPWRSIWAGSSFTALLFTGGKFGLGLYLGRSSTASSYGAAGSVLIVLLWVYYSALILYYGAEFTQVYTENKERNNG